MRVDHQVGRGRRSRRAWRRSPRASGTAARRRARIARRVDLDQMPPRRVAPAPRAATPRPSPAHRRGTGSRLGAADRAPDAAHQAEAVAADALERGLMAIGRADPGARLGDDRGAGDASCRPKHRAVVAAASPGVGIAHDEVVAGDVREAAEIDGVGEASRQVAKRLSQPAVTVKVSPARDRLGHRLPQLDRARRRHRRDASSPRPRARHSRRT